MGALLESGSGEENAAIKKLLFFCKRAVVEQVVGAFLESGSGEENAAMKKVADLRPDAPSNLESEGLAFASKL